LLLLLCKGGLGKPSLLLYIYIIMKQETINGLSIGHVKQIIRRSMIQKTKPSKKVYDRKNNKKHLDN
jgi:hypothetical protein